MQIQGKYRCINCFSELENEGEACSCGYNQPKYRCLSHWLVPGTILDNRYYVGRVIGEGGFGITYVGYDVNLDVKVAIKEFFLSGINSRNATVSADIVTGIVDKEEMFEAYRDKFINEARILAKFNDEDGIVTILNFFKDNNTAYIIMEFLDGENLKEYLASKGKLSVDETVEIFLRIMRTLDDVHQKQLIHRDISPDNIIFTKRGKVKLLDFGAARNVSDGNKSLSVVLKHGYAPPEQYQTRGKQGPWTDIYALSATIYKCLTGNTPTEAVDRTLGGELLPIFEVTGGECPQSISDVIKKGLAIQIEQRYQTMGEMADDLLKAKSNPSFRPEGLVEAEPSMPPMVELNKSVNIDKTVANEAATNMAVVNEGSSDYVVVNDTIINKAVAGEKVIDKVAVEENAINKDATTKSVSNNENGKKKQGKKTRTIITICSAALFCIFGGIIALLWASNSDRITGLTDDSEDNTTRVSTKNKKTDADSDDSSEATTDVAYTTEESTAVEESSAYTILTDDNGNPIDLGGMEIIVRNWWSPEEKPSPTNDYEEAREEYQQWIQETYNFKIREVAISDWGSAPQDFVDYVTTGGDSNNYVFTLRNDHLLSSAMYNGLVYDLSTLDCLDFSRDKFQRNRLHEQYSVGNSIYCMSGDVSEARTGVYFNKRLVANAGIDPDSIYDMQANGTWTWSKFEELMAQCQRDTDGDGLDDVYGLTLNEVVMADQAVFSNGGSYVGKDASGKFYYNLEATETQEALEWCVNMYNKFDNHDPKGAEWDYYKEEFINGKAAFMVEQEYAGTPGNFLSDMKDEVGFVMFPKGPKYDNYINIWDNNPLAIPACYDADRAWKIAFAWNLYTDDAPGYEGYNPYLATARAGIFDTRAVEETITMMSEPAHGTIAYHNVIPYLQSGSELTWSIMPGANISALTKNIASTWKAYVNEANKY